MWIDYDGTRYHVDSDTDVQEELGRQHLDLSATACRFRIRGIQAIIRASAGRRKTLIFYRLRSGAIVEALGWDARSALGSSSRHSV